ncbi:hypothetical protein TanjilG_19753 [Lupinus angustifolius]|uniref:1,4-alpha-glucan branching enzyme n=1 Tax=Lupinus angustifolius TaxID=3871 RepID=A0A1J7IES4_LUPAN|nr:hypothetical protein TanjilG_19753 [Lupinus angustifolius]
MGINPVGFLVKRGITHKVFGQFLRERQGETYKALKDLKDEIFNRHINLKDMSTGYELLGMHRHPEHRADYMEWAPGARYCAIIGDFNGWSPTENCAREGRFGHDDYGYWFIILQDKLREGEKPDELYFQRYNYLDEYDKGDSGVTIEELFKKSNDEYWQPGEDRYLNNRFEGPAKLYEEIFGPNGPQTLEDLPDLPDAETRYKEWAAEHGPSRYAVIDSGNKEFDIFSLIVDPEWRERIRKLKPPLAYWNESRKGRKAWLKKYIPAIPHGSKYRVYFNTPNGPLERVPAWASYVQPEADGMQAYAIHWDPPPEQAYKRKNTSPKVPNSLRIYEAHVGISGSEPKISSFNDFTDKVLPHIKVAGYNAIQLIGVIEHKDYFTVGYRVTNFYAVSSRYGTPDDFKRLVDEAHGLGLLVFLEIVHSYAAADEMVGLSMFDGSNDCYFHSALCFRNRSYSEATFYPGLCEPISQGGLGFDYYVNLSVSEMWSTFLESVPDNEWSMTKIVNTLVSNREYADKMLTYAENYNQSISRRRSFAEILFGELDEHSHHYKESFMRGSSLHKMIRLITLTIGGRAYLNFMGNEFGHPKGVEFPASSNNFSYSLANRQWDLLAKEVNHDLFSFDKDMMKLDKKERVLSRGFPNVHHVNDNSMVISYIRGPLLFIFNFHPTDSYDSYAIGVEEAGEYQIILNTDEIKYGGQGSIKEDQYLQRTVSRRVDGLRTCLEVPLPSRTAQVDNFVEAITFQFIS